MASRYRREAQDFGQSYEEGEGGSLVNDAFVIPEINEFLGELQRDSAAIIEWALEDRLKGWLSSKWPALVEEILVYLTNNREVLGLTPEDEDYLRSKANGYAELALDTLVTEFMDDIREQDSSYAVSDVLNQLRKEFSSFLLEK